ncbi:MAG: iron-only hydrogenase system regulator [Proteobacteria bacterium]|nr:iron-only hydrogenase system regulator [Pseudomonadota bacterium]MBQ4359079.1 iron-only hydrogenase system regulator [Pseudomonadota bacterium]
MAEETRVAVLGIIVENMDSVEALNAIVHDYRDIVLGRMGIPYRQKKINIVSLAVDAPAEVINALSGKIGRLPGITVKTAYANTRT